MNDETSNIKYKIQSFPVLAIFRGADRFRIYEGDLTKQENVLKWLTSNEVFQIRDEIEEVNRKMLEKIITDNDFVTVYFCTHTKQSDYTMRP